MMNKTRLLGQALAVGVLVALVVAFPARAQEPPPDPALVHLVPALHFTHLTSDDGLAQNTVNAIWQDRRGFMWIGTTDGLSRYDGYDFKTYRNDPDDTNSLGINWIHDLFEDSDGMIWIGTEGAAVDKFDPLTETFTHFPMGPNGLGGDRVFHIFRQSTGDLWFTGGGLTGVNKLSASTQIITQYGGSQNPNIFQGNPIGSMVEDPMGKLWLAADQVLAAYDPRKDSFAYFTPPPENPTVRLNVVHFDNAGNLWVAGSALYRFDMQHSTFSRVGNLQRINDMIDDGSGNFWIGAGDGLYLFNPLTQQILEHFHHDALVPDSLSDDSVTRLYRDRGGVLWIGTSNGGLNVVDPRQMRFAHYRHDPTNPASLAHNGVDALYVADNTHLWVGTGEVLDAVNLATGEVTHYPLPVEANKPATVAAVYQDHTGVVWVGTKDFRLYRFDAAAGTYSQYPLKSQFKAPTPPKSIVGFYEDASGALWVAVSQDGLYRLDSTGENVQFYPAPEAPPPPNNSSAPNSAPPGSNPPPNAPNAPGSNARPAGAPRPPITSIMGDHAGNIWATTLNGLIRFDPRAGKFERLHIRDVQPDSYMEATLEDPDGTVWVASRDGLIHYDPAAKTSRYYTTKDGLPVNWIVGIEPDGAGNLWLSTKKGLSRFTPATGAFRNYTAFDGLQGSEFNAGALGRSPNGQLFFGGSGGLTAFYPGQITDTAYNPPVVLTDFQVPNGANSESPLTAPIWATDSLSLAHDQNLFSFEFSVLDYPPNAQNHYRYQLEGFDTDWKPADSGRNFTTYTNIPPGQYVFRVQATNKDGAWSRQEVALPLTIRPPWWEETWFRVLVVVLVIGGVLGGYQWRVYAIARRNRDLEREVARQTHALQERTQALQASESQLRHAKDAAEAANRAKSAFLANMSHELRSPLNAILGFAQVTNRNSALPREVHSNLSIIVRSGEHLLALINQVLDLSKIEAGQMTLNDVNFDLYRMLDDLEDMFLLKADDQHLRLVFERSAALPRYLRADAVRLRQVLINLIGNALKFTEKGTVTVRAARATHADANGKTTLAHLRFEVEDTGPGIPQDEIAALFQPFSQTTVGQRAQEGTGLGLTISRRFVELMGGSITVNSQVGQGTTFSFDIQCQEVTEADIPELSQERSISALQPDQPRYRILAVDDKWVNRQLLVKLLAPLGFEVREAENGQEAVDIAQVFQPHLIWMDMRMPVLDGMEATRRIKATGQAVVIIALTASAYDEERADILAAGCDDFVRKPCREQEVFAILGKYLGVRYVYADDPPAALVDADKLSLEAVKAALNDLPAGVLARLTEGTELGDVAMMDATIADIREQNPALGAALARLAQRFEYDELLGMLKESLP